MDCFRDDSIIGHDPQGPHSRRIEDETDAIEFLIGGCHDKGPPEKCLWHFFEKPFYGQLTDSVHYVIFMAIMSSNFLR